jgi:hypothetical protein
MPPEKPPGFPNGTSIDGDPKSKDTSNLHLCSSCTSFIVPRYLEKNSRNPFVLNHDQMRRILTETECPTCDSCELIGNAFHLNSLPALRELARPGNGYSSEPSPPVVHIFPETGGIVIRGDVEEEEVAHMYGTLVGFDFKRSVS